MKILLSLLTLILFGNCNTETIPKPIKLTESIPLIETQTQKEDSIKNKLEWITNYDIKNTLINRVEAPEGFFRKEYEVNSFAHWIRRLPLKEGTPNVQLYNGDDKWNQNAHAYVFDLGQETIMNSFNCITMKSQ